MPTPVPIIRFAGFAFFALATASLLPGGARDLAANSPFMPPGTFAGPAAVTEGGSLELRSIMVLGGAPQFSIYDSSNKRASWVGLNDADQDFAVKSYDAKAETVNVEYHGRPLMLVLQKARIGAAAMPVPGAPAVAGGQMPAPLPPPSSGLVNTVKINPTPAEEAQRLQAVVEEIRRRREQRQQVGQQQPLPSAVQQQGQGNRPSSSPNIQQARPASHR